MYTGNSTEDFLIGIIDCSDSKYKVIILYLAWTSNTAFPGIIFTDWTSHSTVTIANPPHWSAS